MPFSSTLSIVARKIQTTKDLERPWGQLPGNHSALTTLLLDDSPAKVKLQPYNHVCVKEYNQQLRLKDLRTKVIKSSAASSPSSPEDVIDRTGANQSTIDTEEADGVAEHGSAQQARRKEKKMRKKASKLTALLDNVAAAKYDETLLAVIGILDVVRVQSNVAAWVRKGGLWALKSPPVVADGTVATRKDEKSDFQRAQSPTDMELNDVDNAEASVLVASSDDFAAEPPSSSLPLRSSSPASSPPSSPGFQQGHTGDVQAGELKSTRAPLGLSLNNKRVLSFSPCADTESEAKRPRKGGSNTINHEQEDRSGLTTEMHARVDPVAAHAGNDADAMAHTKPTSAILDAVSHPRTPSVERIQAASKSADTQQPSLWFEDEDVFYYWVAEGRRVLKDLNIAEETGIIDG